MPSSEPKKVFVVIPAYNEERVIERVLRAICTAFDGTVILVDDGSVDHTALAAQKVPGVKVLRHQLNRGKGAATKTGIEAAKMLDADIIVTMDGDGQHDPQDLSAMIAPIQAEYCDVVLGFRRMRYKEMPLFKIISNKLGNVLTWYIYGLMVKDSQSGFRAYSARAAHLIDTVGDRYEYESEVIREIYLRKIKYQQVPIATHYTQYSTSKDVRQGLTNGIKTIGRMILKFFH